MIPVRFQKDGVLIVQAKIGGAGISEGNAKMVRDFLDSWRARLFDEESVDEVANIQIKGLHGFLAVNMSKVLA